MTLDKTTLRQPTFIAFAADPHSAQVLRDLSLDHLGIKTFVYDGGIEGAEKYLRTHRTPGILLLDVGNVERPISAVSTIAALCEPGVAVIVVGDRNDVGIFRGLTSMGVSDYLVKPLVAGFLQRSIKRIIAKDKAQAAGKHFASTGQVVAFLGCRGGVGTTTLCTSVAHTLTADLERRAVIFDAAAHTGNVPQLLGIETGKAFLSVMGEPSRIDKVLAERHCTAYDERLSILACHVGLSDHVTYTPEALYATLDALKQSFPYVFVDVPRSYGHGIAQTILSASNTACLVVDPTIISLRDLVRITSLISEFGISQPQVGIIMNRMGEYKRHEISRTEFEEAARMKIHFEVRFDDSVPMLAMMDGKPVSAYRSRMHQGISDIAHWLVGDNSSRGSGFLQRMKAAWQSRTATRKRPQS